MSCPAYHPLELGVVTALAAERRAWTGWRGDGSRARGDGWQLLQSGIGPERAALAADRLLADGVRALLSWGVAGGLDPALRPGDLVLCRQVRWEEGEAAVDADWFDGLHAALDATGGIASTGTLWSQRTAVMSTQEKRRLAITHAATVVDMESAAVARAARRAGVPFAILKAVCDPAGYALPDAASSLLRVDGSLQTGRLLLMLSQGSGAWRALWRMRRDYRAACTGLRRAAKVVGP